MSDNSPTSPLYERNEAYHEILTEASILENLNYRAVREERFRKGKAYCPHCLQEKGKTVSEYVRYGRVSGTGWQRYRCKQCERIFSDLTQTFFHRSRNVNKWPSFIRLALIERLPFKQIAQKLGLHINTVYTWNKKLTAFFDQFLPCRQLQLVDQKSHDCAIVAINCVNKGGPTKDKHLEGNSGKRPASVTVAVNHESANQILFQLSSTDFAKLSNSEKEPSTAILAVKKEIDSYFKKKRGVPFRTLYLHMTYFRMLKLTEAINPVILPMELFYLCLDKQILLKSNRLLKRLI